MGRLVEVVLPSALAEAQLRDAGDCVVVHAPSRFTSQATGVSVDMDVVELYFVAGGKITKTDVYYKEPEAIAALPSDFREALVAVDVLGLRYREAARALRIREGTLILDGVAELLCFLNRPARGVLGSGDDEVAHAAPLDLRRPFDGGKCIGRNPRFNTRRS